MNYLIIVLIEEFVIIGEVKVFLSYLLDICSSSFVIFLFVSAYFPKTPSFFIKLQYQFTINLLIYNQISKL